MPLTGDAIRSNASARVKENRVSLDSCLRLMAAYTVLSIAENVHRVDAGSARGARIKALLVRDGTPNGTAAAYSKAIDKTISDLLSDFGFPQGEPETDFWKSWKSAKCYSERESVVVNRLQALSKENGIESIGGLMRLWSIPYGRNHKNDAPRSKDREMSRNSVLASLLSLKPSDQKWVLDAWRAIKRTKM